MDALIQSFWTGFGYAFGVGMGITCWITVLIIISPKKKNQP